MTRIVWAPQALDDVQAIQDYLSRGSAEYANLITQLIMASVSRLERHPRSGRIVPEVREPPFEKSSCATIGLSTDSAVMLPRC